MTQDITSTDALLEFIAANGHLREQVVQELDLRELGPSLQGISGERSAFLGCRMDAETIVHLYRSGADLFPPLAEGMRLPFRPYRSGLYTVDELYEGFDPAVSGSFERSARDSQIYRYFTARREAEGPISIMEALAMRLHDHAIEDALTGLLRDYQAPGEHRVAAIMGGHAMRRGEPAYREIAELARGLARRGYLVATGGGPGAMEAGNLGAYLAPRADDALDQAIELLAREVDYHEHHYLQLALEVRERWPAEGAGRSLAIPTWFYGHEPSNMFASDIAKYFANSVREDGLLAIATAGVIYAPGSAGTVQEIFMDVCQNHYVTFEVVSPMVFLSSEYWTKTLPVWPLLEAMSAGRAWGGHIGLADGAEEALGFLLGHPPFVPG
ncbi:hypothetical protein G6O69_34880 [Pseudenhygromyxa sp. WMMC2535]|uniref:LOG family protein n=1 Tax=Pseudenhygromyxa sp. WMMC2535 TaxID=2712867 RepID=UPI001552ECA9|nr:hypothetical protein [Pseudenhygromyxa sp. WMMC2535]NVB43060.1 hypothetical protein [Pseudenhygromyxa sp. WMMC2535]